MSGKINGGSFLKVGEGSTIKGPSSGNNFDHYYKNVKELDFIDIYRVLDLYQVYHPCIQHAVKKLLVAGGRGHKDQTEDIQEAITSLTRWLEMRREDGGRED